MIENDQLEARIAVGQGVVAALQGRYDEALVFWERALELDPSFLSARLNRDLLLSSHRQLSSEGVAAITETPPDEGSSIKVAILSFLFNWPSTGGGTVHTYELAKFLGRAGYDILHVYATYEPWGVGEVTGVLPYPSQKLVFKEAEWDLATVLTRFRAALDAFGPDYVIVTDSWNIKPLLAEAARNYPYILRLQALECLCPLNNVRLLPNPQGGFVQCMLNQLDAYDHCVGCLEDNRSPLSMSAIRGGVGNRANGAVYSSWRPVGWPLESLHVVQSKTNKGPGPSGRALRHSELRAPSR